MPPKGPPPFIHSDAFEGIDSLEWEEYEALRVIDPKDAAANLVQEWTSGCVGMVALELSNDCRKVENAAFLLLGSFFEDQPRVVSTDKFWPGSKAKLVMKELDGALFSFENALVSNLVDCSQLPFSFKLSVSGKALNSTEAKEKGLGPFSLRCHIQPTSESSALASLILFPLDAKSLQERYPLARDPRFPGLEFGSGLNINLAPRQEEILEDKSWGQPLLPAFLSPTPFSEDSPLPQDSMVKKAVVALLRSASKPDVKRSWNYLAPLWEKSLEEGESSLKTIPGDLQWPALDSMFPQQGRNPFFLCQLFIYLFSLFNE